MRTKRERGQGDRKRERKIEGARERERVGLRKKEEKWESPTVH